MFLVLTSTHFSIVVVYISPNIKLYIYESRLSDMMSSVERGDKVLVVGDLNVKPSEWGSPRHDKRGEILVEWIAALDLVVHNTGAPTFIRVKTKSHIDISCSTQSLTQNVQNWRVLPKEGLDAPKGFSFEPRREHYP